MRIAKKMLAVLVSALFLLTGCSTSVDLLSTVQKSGTLRVLVVKDGGIYSRAAADGSGQEGIEIGIARQIADDLGVTLETVPVEKSELLSGLDDGEGDLAIGRIADNDSLQHNDAVSISYESGRLYAVTLRGVFYPTLGALEGKTIGVSDQLSETALISTAGIEDVTRQTYTDISTVEQNLQSSAISAYLCYDEQAAQLADLSTLQVQNLVGIDSEQYVVVASKGAQTLIAKVNLTLTRMLESDQITQLHESFTE